MASEQQRTVIILLAILLAVLIVSAGLVWLLPRQTGEDQIDTVGVPAKFNLGVLQRTAFQVLDQRLIQEGALPVQPPVGVGKANPFL